MCLPNFPKQNHKTYLRSVGWCSIQPFLRQETDQLPALLPHPKLIVQSDVHNIKPSILPLSITPKHQLNLERLRPLLQQITLPVLNVTLLKAPNHPPEPPQILLFLLLPDPHRTRQEAIELLDPHPHPLSQRRPAQQQNAPRNHHSRRLRRLHVFQHDFVWD
jgi:hypothetical protein